MIAFSACGNVEVGVYLVHEGKMHNSYNVEVGIIFARESKLHIS